MNSKIIQVGPFAEATANVEALANNLYINTLYMQTLEQMMKAEEEYEAAVLHGDVILIEKRLSELTFIEEIIKLTGVNYSIHQADGLAE
jgi:hypothetical protein|tara:strand:+ start:4404 stop:4670 length:267 start_codon:yes stop_codon:yes gene_type:complete